MKSHTERETKKIETAEYWFLLVPRSALSGRGSGSSDGGMTAFDWKQPIRETEWEKDRKLELIKDGRA
jgi:hypothetical protein